MSYDKLLTPKLGETNIQKNTENFTLQNYCKKTPAETSVGTSARVEKLNCNE